MKNIFKSIKRSKGISLLEVLLSISIIAIILVMATRYYFVASNNDKVNTTVSQLGGVIAASHSWKGAQPTYTGVSVAELGSTNQLTNFPGFNNSGDAATLKTMWGQNITIAEDTTGGASLAAITMLLPDSVTCATLLRSFPSDSSANITSACADSTFTYTFP